MTSHSWIRSLSVLSVSLLALVPAGRLEGTQDAASSAGALGRQSAGRDEALEALREGLGPIGVPVLSMSIPRQIAAADLARWTRLLEIEPRLAARLRNVLSEASARDDSMRLKRLPRLFELAAMVVAPNQSMDSDEVTRLSQTLVDTRRRVVAELLSQERESLRSALGTDDVDEAELAILEAIGNARLIALVEGSVATPEAAKVSIGRLLDAYGPRLLSDRSSAVARTLYRDKLGQLAELARAHQAALGRSLGSGAKLSLGSSLVRRFASISRETLATWKDEHADDRRDLARAGERMFEANQSLVESICSAIPGDEAQRLRAQYGELVYGPFAVDVWDARPLLLSWRAAPGRALADVRPFVDEYTEGAAARLRAVQREFIRYQVLETASMGMRREDWTRACERIAGFQRQLRDQSMLMLDQIRACIDPSDRDAWDAEVERFASASEEAARKQLAALDPDFGDARVRAGR